MTRRQTIAAAILTLAGSVAVATLVWAGHAGATEGTAGTVHRVSDILHLLAAAAWIGAIGAFLILIAPQRLREWPGGLQIAARSLDQFSRVGTICVLVIAATGRSEEHTSELQSLMRISYAVFCLQKKITVLLYRTRHRITYHYYIATVLYIL